MIRALTPAMLVLIAACTTETMQPAAAPSAAAPAATAATTAPANDAGLGPLVNAFRAANGLGPLAYSPVLGRAANAHLQDMVSNGFFSHDGSDGSSVGDRVGAAGCSWNAVAENIAMGQGSPEAAMATWEASPPHRRNLLGRYSQYGAARSGNLWVLVFASGC